MKTFALVLAVALILSSNVRNTTAFILRTTADILSQTNSHGI